MAAIPSAFLTLSSRLAEIDRSCRRDSRKWRCAAGSGFGALAGGCARAQVEQVRAIRAVCVPSKSISQNGRQSCSLRAFAVVIRCSRAQLSGEWAAASADEIFIASLSSCTGAQKAAAGSRVLLVWHNCGRRERANRLGVRDRRPRDLLIGAQISCERGDECGFRAPQWDWAAALAMGLVID